MMFIKNVLLGSLSFATFLIEGNWSGAIAENRDKFLSTTDRLDEQNKLKSSADRYPTPEEVRRLAQEFEQNVIPSVRRSRNIGLGERSRQLDAFVRDWSKVNPEVAPFLGSWNKTVSDFMIYPSSKGRACVVFTLPSRPSGKLEAFFAIASISNGYLQLKTNGWNNNFLSSGVTLIRNGNYLGIASVEQGKQNIRLQSAFSDPLRPITSLPLANTDQNKKVIQQFSDAGCTASLPSQVSDSHSNGYLSDQEIESIQPSKYILRQLQYYTDNRSRYKIEQITQFKNDWSNIDPTLAPFLGQWQGYERSMVSIYPSNTKGKSCVITSFGEDVRDSSGIRNIYEHTFGIGKISGKNLLVETEGGEKFTIVQQSANTQNGKINILAVLAKIPENHQFSAFAFPLLLEAFNAQKLQQFGCTTLPPKDLPRNNDRAIPSTSTDKIAKYPTNEDFNAFEDKLQANPESLVKLRGNQAEQRRKFQNDWKSRNPNAAKFLGAWYTGDRYFYVFPSTVKGGTCVVTQDANRNLNMQIGSVLNQELRYGGGKGFFWRDRENIVASRDSGSGGLYPIYATFGMPELPENMISDMERQKCITTLPIDPIATKPSPKRTDGQILNPENVRCTKDPKTVLGQQVPDYCTSSEATSGILIDEFKPERNSDNSINLKLRVFNRGTADGIVEIYDSRNRLQGIKIIDGNRPPTGLIQSGNDLFTKVPSSLFSRYPLGDARRDLKEQSIDFTIPSRGYAQITKSSNFALWYNTAMIALEIAQLAGGDPEFVNSETVKQLVSGFAKEFATSSVINIFKGEVSLQSIASLDFVDKNKLAEVLQKLVQYSVTVEKDPSKNPILGAFSEVYQTAGNVGLERILDRYVLPGLGTLAKGVRVGGEVVNIAAKAIDTSNAKKSGRKSTIIFRDSQ